MRNRQGGKILQNKLEDKWIEKVNVLKEDAPDMFLKNLAVPCEQLKSLSKAKCYQ